MESICNKNLPQDKFQIMKLNKSPMIKPPEIKTVPKEEKKDLLAPNGKTNHQKNPCKSESHYLHFFNKYP